jgi:hypothetical protein
MSSVVLITLLSASFVVFAAGGVYMGVTFRREAHYLSALPNTPERHQQIRHCEGLEFAAYIASFGVLIFGVVIGWIVWMILASLERIVAIVA